LIKYFSFLITTQHRNSINLLKTIKIIKEDITEIIAIDSNDPLYYDQISNLDYLPTRTFSTGYIFYVKKNQSDAKEIINNMVTKIFHVKNSRKIQSNFDLNFRIQAQS